LDRVMYVLGYIPKENRLYLGDKELNIVSYSLLLSVLEYQTAVMRKDFDTADKVLPIIPKEQRNRVAHFLEKQGFKPQAMAVTCDPEHKFELALQLADMKTAYSIASDEDTDTKWKQLADLALSKSEFGLAQEALQRAKDFGGLLLLSTSAGNVDMVGKLADMSRDAGHNNVSFLSYFMLGETEKCLELLITTGRLPEAAFFARTYLPSQTSRVSKLWKESVAENHPKLAATLADPAEYDNLFPGLKESETTEKYLTQERKRRLPARAFPTLTINSERNVEEELEEATTSGRFNPAADTSSDAAPGAVAADNKPQAAAGETDDLLGLGDPVTSTQSTQPPPSQPPESKSPPPEAKAPPPTAPTTTTTQQLEDELELDLENMKIDENIDTSNVDFDDLLGDD